MKKVFFIIMTSALLLVCQGCSENLLMGDERVEPLATDVNHHDNVTRYQEQARWGDGKAYLKLASCYHEGLGVERNLLLTMSMVKMAVLYGGINSWMDFFLSLPDDDPDRLLVEALEDASKGRYDEVLQKAELMDKLGIADADFVRALTRKGGSNIEEEMALLHNAKRKGSVLAGLVISIAKDERLAMEEYAEQMPILYCELARECHKSGYDSEIEEQTANLYRKADERLCLDYNGAKWLLSYYEHQAEIGKPIVDDQEICRLRSLVEKLKANNKASY